jgi:hypothetical protein
MPEAEFPYGVLLVTDATSTEQIPSWTSPEEPVTAAATALAVRVRHADEGAVAVHVVDSVNDVAGGQLFGGGLDLPSGVLRVSDALGTVIAELSVPPGRVAVELYADSVTEAAEVYLVVGQRSETTTSTEYWSAR